MGTKNKKVGQLKKSLKLIVSSMLNRIKNVLAKLKKRKMKVDINSLTSKEIEEELKRESYKFKYVNVLKSTIYVLVIIAAFATLLATFFMPVFQISGNSMTPKYKNGDYVVSYKTKKIKRGDIIAFYYGNKILVKRVIAESGEWVSMDDDGNVYVNGTKLEESYLISKELGGYDIKFPYQVPDGKWFVLSDNRKELIDSRNSSIGCVSQDDVIGKILFKIWNSN